MRNTIFALASSALLLGAVVVGCGGGGTKITKTDGGTGDMKVVPKGDLAVMPGTQLSCSAYVDCENNCYTTSADSTAAAACVKDTCDANAKSTVTNTKGDGLFDKASICYELYCIGKNFDMPYKCGIDFATNKFTEKDGTAIKQGGVCETCLIDASALLFGTACTDAMSTDCSTAANSMAASTCGATINACLNNK